MNNRLEVIVEHDIRRRLYLIKCSEEFYHDLMRQILEAGCKVVLPKTELVIHEEEY